MKLYSLTKKRLTNLKSLKYNELNLHILLGATIFILGGFFYSHIIFAKSLSSPIVNTSASDEIVKTESSKDKDILSLTKTKQSNASEEINLDIKSPTEKLSSLSSKSHTNHALLKQTVPPEQSNQSSPLLDVAKINKNLDLKNISTSIALKNELATILIGTPMEDMIDLISQQDKIVAAFLVGIALKESGLGRHVPVLNGQDCYNYWGYRGKRKRMGSGGHTCFDNPEDAIKTVAKRIHTLAVKQNRNTPRKMLIWKCGRSCASHSPTGVAKWVSDVSIYFNQINNS